MKIRKYLTTFLLFLFVFIISGCGNDDLVIKEASTIKDIEVKGDLIISKKVGDGDIFIENVTVLGETIVEGGGENSVHFTNCSLIRLRINREDGPVRVTLEGETTVEEVQGESKNIIVENKSFHSIKKLIILNKKNDDQNVAVQGVFDNVDVSSNVNLTLRAGTEIEMLETDSEVENEVVLILEEDSSINNSLFNSEVSVRGSGSLRRVRVNNEEIELNIIVEEIVIEEGVSKITVNDVSYDEEEIKTNTRDNGFHAPKPPVIEVSKMLVEVEVGSEVIYPDIYCDNNGVSCDAIISGSVDSEKIGEYNFTASYKNDLGVTVVPFVIKVIDTKEPKINIEGEDNITLEVGSEYTESNVTCVDNYDEECSITTEGSVNPNIIGEYKIIYTATDSSGNIAQKIKYIEVVDSEAPEIVLNGDASLSVYIGSDFSDPGATCTDNYDESCEVSISGEVDTATTGTYTLTYSATDSSGNSTVVERIVIVKVKKSSSGGGGSSTPPPQPALTILNTASAISSSSLEVTTNIDFVGVIISDSSIDINNIAEDDWTSVDVTNSYTFNNLADDYYEVVVRDSSKKISNKYTLTVDTTDPIINVTRIDNYTRTFNEPLAKNYGLDVDMDSDYIVVGAPSLASSGGVHVYKVSDENYHREIVTSSGLVDINFGFSVSIEDQYIVVGANNDSINGPNAGLVFVYNVNDLSERIVSSSTPNDYDMFGNSVSASGDYFIIGAPSNSSSSGYAMLYKFSDPSYERKIVPSNSMNGDDFGCSVAIDGDNIVVTAKNIDDEVTAFIYKVSDELYEREIESAYAGYAIYATPSVTIDGDYFAIGALNDNDKASGAGAVYVYKFSDSSYEDKIMGSDSIENDYFGSNVSLDGNNLLVSAIGQNSNSGKVYLYHLDDSSFEQQFTAETVSNNDYYGRGLKINGNNILVGVNKAEEGFVELKPINTGYYVEVLETNISSTSITKDGLDYSLEGDYIKETGEYVITITDIASNEVMVEVNADLQAPSPTESLFFNITDVTITFDEESKLSTDDGETWTELSSGLTHNLSGLIEGTHDILVSDVLGNVSDTLVVTIDLTDPLISVNRIDDIYHINVVETNLATITITKDGQPYTPVTQSQISEEGTYVIIAEDSAGNSATYNLVTDYQGPVISNTDLLISTDTFTLNTDEAFVAYSLNNGSNWVDITPSASVVISGLSDTTYTIVAKDTVGNVSSTSYTVRVSAKNPTITNIGNEIINVLTQTITASEVFNEISIDDGITWLGVSETTSYTVDLVVGINKVKVKDLDGNISAPFIITVDQTLPVITNTNNVFSTTTITVTADEEFNSISLSNGLAWEDISPTTSYIVSGLPENTYIYVKVKDIATNESLSKRFYIDTVDPQIQVYPNAEYYFFECSGESYSDGICTVTATKAGSPYVMDTGNKISEDGTYIVTATDAAGNASSVEVTININPPVINPFPEWTNSGVITLSANEEFVAYSINSTTNWTSVASTTSYALDSLGEGIFYIRVKDSEGNMSDSVALRIDRSDPMIFNSKNGNQYEVTVNEYLSTFTVTKGGEEIESRSNTEVDLSQPFIITVNDTYEITATDVAGNSTTQTLTINDLT
ncbi:DUF5011 domain-containing protein [Mycoplasmatota bacterium]|nr:DUF5011 domain-containing protein [Mycoplasmatota bacterium]